MRSPRLTSEHFILRSFFSTGETLFCSLLRFLFRFSIPIAEVAYAELSKRQMTIILEKKFAHSPASLCLCA